MKFFNWGQETPSAPVMPDTSGWTRTDTDTDNFSRARMFDLNDEQWQIYAGNQSPEGPASAPAHAHDMLRKALLASDAGEDSAIVDSLAPPLDMITEPTLMQVGHPRFDKAGNPAGRDWGSYVIDESLIDIDPDALNTLQETTPFGHRPTGLANEDAPIAPVIDIFTGKELQ